MSARPYILLRDSDRTGLRRRLQAIVSAWCAEWLAGGDSPVLGALEVVDALSGDGADEASPEPLWCATDRTGDMLGLIELSDPAGLVDALLGVRDEAGRALGAIEQALLDRCLGDLCGRLPAGAGERLTEESAAHALVRLGAAIGPGAQAIRTDLTAGGLRLSLLLAPAAVRALIERPAPESFPADAVASDRLTTLREITDSCMRATARLGEVEMTVRDLASLHVGDVIRLDTRTDEPVRIDLPGAGRTLLASLGTAAGEPALQIRSVVETDKNNLAEGSH
jgi:flagellar motor switch/type III secretory pathway protein FliN